jgi:dolichol kinase
MLLSLSLTPMCAMRSSLSLFSGAGAFPLDWGVTLPPLLLICAVATLVEALPVTDTLDDNISVPSVAMLLGALLL